MTAVLSVDLEDEDTLVNENPIRMIRSDVTIVKIAPDLCPDCEPSTPVTHEVWMELRAVGTTQSVGRYCRKHAMEMADRIQSSLPESEDE